MKLGGKRPNDSRDHYYVARCVQCPEWIQHCDGAPVTADMRAVRHARTKKGHEAYVINLHTLAVVSRYFLPRLELGDEPPF